MPLAQRTEVVSLVLSIGVGVVALLLAAWLWYERRLRDPELSDEDAAHFARQDVRRGAVAVILLLIAAGLSIGSRVEPRAAGRANQTFVLVWLGVSVLILVLLLLATFDWIATRTYARRHIRALARERSEIIRDEVRRRAAEHKGRNGAVGD